jgi:hypothetical protein
MTPVFERAKTFYALNRVGTVIDISLLYVDENKQLTLFVGIE